MSKFWLEIKMISSSTTAKVAIKDKIITIIFEEFKTKKNGSKIKPAPVILFKYVWINGILPNFINPKRIEITLIRTMHIIHKIIEKLRFNRGNIVIKKQKTNIISAKESNLPPKSLSKPKFLAI